LRDEKVKESIKKARPSFYKILIAEDVALNYFILKSLLEKIKECEFQIIRAENGQVAIEIMEQEQNEDLVFMDIQMPISNDYKTTREIKERFPYTPIVVQTGYSNSEDRQKNFASDCDGFISKPFKLDIVKDVLKKFIPN
jgi:CheY-like chemotaxis protein